MKKRPEGGLGGGRVVSRCGSGEDEEGGKSGRMVRGEAMTVRVEGGCGRERKVRTARLESSLPRAMISIGTVRD
jgi:hypothetical protein